MRRAWEHTINALLSMTRTWAYEWTLIATELAICWESADRHARVYDTESCNWRNIQKVWICSGETSCHQFVNADVPVVKIYA